MMLRTNEVDEGHQSPWLRADWHAGFEGISAWVPQPFAGAVILGLPFPSLMTTNLPDRPLQSMRGSR
jgi:hypothetical protein